MIIKAHQIKYNQDVKTDDGKLKMNLIEPRWLDEIAKVLTYGANKYGAYSYKNVDNERLEAASMRHMNEARKGYIYNKETDSEGNELLLMHRACAVVNQLFLLSKELEDQTLDKILDDIRKL